MKTTFINSLKPLTSDRLLAVLMTTFIVACLVYCIYVAVSLHPSDLQVAVHYTAYGDTNFYRDKWYYLISFIGLGLILAIVHTIITGKIYLQSRRPLAILFIALSFLMLLIIWLVTRSVLGIAFL